MRALLINPFDRTVSTIWPVGFRRELAEIIGVMEHNCGFANLTDDSVLICAQDLSINTPAFVFKGWNNPAVHGKGVYLGFSQIMKDWTSTETKPEDLAKKLNWLPANAFKLVGGGENLPWNC